jgi:hypothetical protein
MPAPRAGDLGLEDVDPDGAVLLVEKHELCAGICCDLADARREELGGEDAVSRFASLELRTDGIAARPAAQ